MDYSTRREGWTEHRTIDHEKTCLTRRSKCVVRDCRTETGDQWRIEWCTFCSSLCEVSWKNTFLQYFLFRKFNTFFQHWFNTTIHLLCVVFSLRFTHCVCLLKLKEHTKVQHKKKSRWASINSCIHDHSQNESWKNFPSRTAVVDSLPKTTDDYNAHTSLLNQSSSFARYKRVSTVFFSL